MSYVILFSILIGHINADSAAADTNPDRNHAVDGILRIKTEETKLESPDGIEMPIKLTSSGCNECGLAYTGLRSNMNDPKLIVNGTPVEPPNKYPWMAAVARKGYYPNCGGAIINEYFILTAAHCLKREGIVEQSDTNKCKYKDGSWGPCYYDQFVIVFLSTEPDIKKGKHIPVAEVYPHPQFRRLKSHRHDIALLKMKEPIQCNEFRNPICLPPENYSPEIGTVMGIAGWGSTDGSPKGSSTLMEAQIKVVSPEGKSCKKVFRPWDEFYDICLSGEGIQGPCLGDSGGPLFAEEGNKYYTYGVAARHSSKNCNPSFKVVYTSVAAHMDWITEVIGQIPSAEGDNDD